MVLAPIVQEDLRDLRSFAERVDRQMETLCSSQEVDRAYFSPTDRWGHPDLQQYLPWMGPRYRFVEHPVPMSVFRGEGVALFLLMRMLRPDVAVECYTGTGYAAAWMAAGSPATSLYTVDNYSEGILGKEGYLRVSSLLRELNLTNVTVIKGSVAELKVSLSGRLPKVYFSDGPLADPMDLSPNTIVVRHDDLNGQATNRSFSLRGGSNLSVMCPSADERDELMKALARYFPVERCDA